MLKISIILMLTAVLNIQCNQHQSRSVTDSVNVPRAENRESAEFEKDMCDFSRFRILKMNSLPAEKMVKPKYPPEAKGQNLKDTVRVKVLVNKQGNVIRACAVEGNEKLRKAAEAAAIESKFKVGLWNSYQAERYDYAEFTISYNFVP